MKSKTFIGILAILTIILGVIIISFTNKNGGWFSAPTASPTKSATPTNTPSLTPTFTSTTTNTLTFTPTFTRTFTPTETSTPTPTPTPIPTFMVECTPPPCAISTRETYYCPGACPGGCGITCATYMPTL